jgi:drug/metabolite transporter (DMT)-like permease
MAPLSEHAKGLVITAAGVLVLTPDSLLIRLITADPWTLLFWRGTLMALGLAVIVAAVSGRATAARFHAIGKAGILVAVVFAAASILFVTALSHTSVANTLVIISVAPLFAALLSRVLLAEPIARPTWAAIAIANTGIVVIFAGSLKSDGLLGDLCALATALLVAAAFVVIRHARKVSMVPAMALSGVLAAAAVLPLATPLSVGAEDAALLLLLGLVVLPASRALITLGPRYLPAAEANLLMLLETVLGPLWVWLALGEEPTAAALIGGAIVILALAAHSAVRLRRPVSVAG